MLFLGLIIVMSGLLAYLDAERMAEVTQHRLATEKIGWLMLPNPPHTQSQWRFCGGLVMSVGALLLAFSVHAFSPFHLMYPVIAFFAIFVGLNGVSIALKPRRRPDVASWDNWLLKDHSDLTSTSYGWTLVYRRVLIAYFTAITKRSFGLVLVAVAVAMVVASV